MKNSIVYAVLCAGIILSGFSLVVKKKFRPEEDHVLIKEKVYFSQKEVSNKEYRAFLNHFVGLADKERLVKYLPDVEVWNRLPFRDPYAKYYFSHEGFSEYPVVGISHEAAVAFCDWLTEQHAITMVVDGKPVEFYKYRFRLPAKEEWELAATGKEGNGTYAGGWEDVKSDKEYYFNSKLGKGNYTGLQGAKPWEGYMITGPVKSFPRDQYGLYNMSGNVAEMLAEPGTAAGGSWFHLPEAARIGSYINYEEPASWLGFRYVVEEISPGCTISR